MNFLRNLRRNVFGPRAVDSIVASVKAQIDELRLTADLHNAKSDQLNAEADAIRAKANEHVGEASKALRVASNFSHLIS